MPYANLLSLGLTDNTTISFVGPGKRMLYKLIYFVKSSQVTFI